MKVIITLILAVLLVNPVSIGFYQNDRSNGNIRIFDGSPGSDLTSSERVLLTNCLDPSLIFINCHGYGSQNTQTSSVTVLVIDDGLREGQWDYLESNTYGVELDIEVFVTLNPNNLNEIIKYTSSEDIDSDLYGNIGAKHGAAVLSSLALVSRQIKVVFMDAIGDYDSHGFDLEESSSYDKMWDWIDENLDEYSVDIILASLSVPDGDFIDDVQSNSLKNKGIPLITSAGNYGNQYNYLDNTQKFVPQKYSAWLSVGSIDHENRGTSQDYDKFSDKGQYSGYAIESSFISSWGSDIYGANSLDWLMPGHGVPIFWHDESKSNPDDYWKYSSGTSYSAPFLAAAISVIIEGYYDGKGWSSDYRNDHRMPYDDIIDVLFQASSRSSFSMRWGYGYINLLEAYTYGKDLGSEGGGSGGGGYLYI